MLSGKRIYSQEAEQGSEETQVRAVQRDRDVLLFPLGFIRVLRFPLHLPKALPLTVK